MTCDPSECGKSHLKESERIGVASMAVPVSGDGAGIRACRDRLKGQPQEVQHSAADHGGNRDRLSPDRHTVLMRRHHG